MLSRYLADTAKHSRNNNKHHPRIPMMNPNPECESSDSPFMFLNREVKHKPPHAGEQLKYDNQYDDCSDVSVFFAKLVVWLYCHRRFP